MPSIDPLPRGVRNRNPCNLRRSRDPWQGLAEEQDDDQFFTFKTAAFGIRAAARVLINYQDRYDICTIRGIINRWAPPSENDTDKYIDTICQRTGLDADIKLDMQRYGDIEPLLTAMIQVECSNYKYPQAVMDEGLKLAGIVNSPKPVITTRTAKAATIAATSTVLQPVLDQATTVLEPIAQYSNYIRLALVGITILSVGYVVWQKIRERWVQTA